MPRNLKSVLILSFAALLTACGSTPGPEPTSPASQEAQMAERLRQSAEGILFFSQADRRFAFANIDRILPTRDVLAGGQPYPLEPAPADIAGMTYVHDGKTHKVADFLARPSMVGFIVVKDGKILLEHHGEGFDENTRWISFSVTKSVTSMLIGAAIRDGFIESVDEPVAHYLPRFRGTPYERATIRDVLNMASGVAWNEDYADPNSDVAKAGGANGITLVQYLAELPVAAEPGTTFNYNTGETNLVGEILRSAIGNNASTYLTHKIWQPFGMESDATWLLGSPGGGETGGCCISATLRDFARVGVFALNDGVLPDGTRVLPEGWMAESTSPSKGYDGYGYLWWLFGEDRYSAMGIFGQRIFVDPTNNLVIAANSNAPTASPGSGGDISYHQHLTAVILSLSKQLGNMD